MLYVATTFRFNLYKLASVRIWSFFCDYKRFNLLWFLELKKQRSSQSKIQSRKKSWKEIHMERKNSDEKNLYNIQSLEKYRKESKFGAPRQMWSHNTSCSRWKIVQSTSEKKTIYCYSNCYVRLFHTAKRAGALLIILLSYT